MPLSKNAEALLRNFTARTLYQVTKEDWPALDELELAGLVEFDPGASTTTHIVRPTDEGRRQALALVRADEAAKAAEPVGPAKEPDTES